MGVFREIWGRKDGFPGADGSTIQVDGTALTISIYNANESPLDEGTATGFKVTNITNIDIVGEDIMSLSYATKSPLTFMTNTINPFDWYTNEDNHNDALWNNGDTKSAYDPCPKKWRIPADSEQTFGDFSILSMAAIYSSETDVANGRKYHTLAWFPAGGNRSCNNGTLYGVGIGGYYWSTAVGSANARYMYFLKDDVFPSTLHGRSFGFSVRCIQE